jgi:glycosyltransferase involved in cell wall biosynthesis
MNGLKRSIVGFVYSIMGPVWHFLATLLLLTIVVPAIWALQKTGVKKRHATPKVVFGTTPLINSKHHAQALRTVGVDSKTVVRHYLGHITTAQDFDVRFGDASPTLPRLRRWYNRLLQLYVEFTKLLWDRDVFFYYFDGFYLREAGPLKWLEVPALKLLGRRVIAMPYGGDVIVAEESRELTVKFALTRDYPIMAQPKYVDLVRRQVRHFTEHADAIIASQNMGPDYLPRVDCLLHCHFAIDEQLWPPSFGPSRVVGDLFRVLHAPNHRNIKGTRFLIQAVEQLKAEGLNIELVLLERVPNAELRRIMAGCHVVADQFVLGMYAMTALEGMASGKPVLCYLREDLVRLYNLYSYEKDCPIVNTPIEKIAENLRWLYNHPQECERIGRDSRLHVERYQGLEAFGGFLKGVVESVWNGKRFDAEEYWHGRRDVADCRNLTSSLAGRSSP